MGGIFPETTRVMLPPLIGGFVGSDALACLAYFNFDKPDGPIAAIDLGTNGEVMVTDGDRILTASTAAGPAFEGVNISCGTCAVDGAIVDVRVDGGEVFIETIAGEAPIGLTGSGLLSTVYQYYKVGLIEYTGRVSPDPPSKYRHLLFEDERGIRNLHIAKDHNINLTQTDVRELQKAKGAIRAAMDVLLVKPNLTPGDLTKVILTGSFGGQVDIEAILEIGMIPPVKREVVQTAANGAGFGAAMFLTDEGFELGEKLAIKAEQVDLDLDANFNRLFIDGLYLSPTNEK